VNLRWPALVACLIAPACVTGSYDRVSVDEPIYAEQLAALRPGTDDLTQCLAALGAPHRVLEYQVGSDLQSGMALVWVWREDAGWGIEVTVQPSGVSEEASGSTGAPGTALTLAIDGTAAGQIAFLIVGQTQGTSTLPLGPLGTLTFGLAQPWAPVPIGQTNGSGDASITVNVPPMVPATLSLLAQGLTLGFTIGQPGPGQPPFSLSSCTTNVAGFSIG
jgi:hypothetical protein